MKHPYSAKSMNLLNQVHPDLRRLFIVAADVMDIAILESTIRTVQQQAELVAAGKSRTMDSKHLDGRAVDAAPYPINFKTDVELWRALRTWADFRERRGGHETMAQAFSDAKETLENIKKWYYFKGVLDGIGKALEIDIRQGHDWDGDEDFTDSSFVDLPHTELRG